MKLLQTTKVPLRYRKVALKLPLTYRKVTADVSQCGQVEEGVILCTYMEDKISLYLTGEKCPS